MERKCQVENGNKVKNSRSVDLFSYLCITVKEVQLGVGKTKIKQELRTGKSAVHSGRSCT